MIVGITGHRPQAIGGFKLPNPVYTYVVSELRNLFTEISPTRIISGMAQGVDTWAAELAIELSIPFIAAVPFKGQEAYWPKNVQAYYLSLLEKAERIEVVSAGGFASWKMQARNRYIVDNCDLMIAVINSNTESGGTFNCVEYARGKEKAMRFIQPDLGIGMALKV